MVSILKFGTMKNYYSTERYLHKFLRDNFKTPDIYLKQLNYRFTADFEQYAGIGNNIRGETFREYFSRAAFVPAEKLSFPEL